MDPAVAHLCTCTCIGTGTAGLHPSSRASLDAVCARSKPPVFRHNDHSGGLHASAPVLWAASPPGAVLDEEKANKALRGPSELYGKARTTVVE